MRRAKLYDLTRHNHASSMAALQQAINKCGRHVDGVMIILATDNGRNVFETIVGGSLTSHHKALFQAAKVQNDIINIED